MPTGAPVTYALVAQAKNIRGIKLCFGCFEFYFEKNIDVFLLSLLTEMGPSLLNKIHLTSRVAPAASYLAPC